MFNLVPLLQQPLVGVHHLQRFRGVAGEDQDFGHRTSSGSRSRSTLDLGPTIRQRDNAHMGIVGEVSHIEGT